jgi:hypothetical protein
MGDLDNRDREEIYSESVRAGKRTYFFDVKATRANEHYLTITESKKRFNNDDGKFYYEKHKIFLYREDFEKFREGLEKAMDYIAAEGGPEGGHIHHGQRSAEYDGMESHDTNFEDENR